MAWWAWTLLAVAALWPVFLIAVVERHIMKTVEMLLKSREERQKLKDQTNSDLKDRVDDLEKLVEGQDALIAILWMQVFGIGHRERFGRAELRSHWSKRPNWYLDAMEEPGVYDTLCRDGKFRSGRTEWLRKDRGE